MNTETLRKELAARGWKLDNFGHCKRTIGGVLWRIKIQKTSVRIEKQVLIVGRKEWMRCGGAYLSRIFVTDDNKLAIDKARLPPL